MANRYRPLLKAGYSWDEVTQKAFPTRLLREIKKERRRFAEMTEQVAADQAHLESGAMSEDEALERAAAWRELARAAFDEADQLEKWRRWRRTK